MPTSTPDFAVPTQLPLPTSQPEIRNLLKLAWPLILSSSFSTIQITVDRIFLSKLSPDAVAAATSAVMLFWCPFVVLFSTAQYVGTFVAQYYGAGRKERVGAAVWQGFLLQLACRSVGRRPAPPLLERLSRFRTIHRTFSKRRRSISFASVGWLCPRWSWPRARRFSLVVATRAPSSGLTSSVAWSMLFLGWALIFGNWGFSRVRNHGCRLGYGGGIVGVGTAGRGAHDAPTFSGRICHAVRLET